MKEEDKKYTTRDLVTFGEYLLSRERERLLKTSQTDIPYKDKFRCVHHADIENWLHDKRQ